MTQSIGQKLKQTREGKRLTIEKASEATHIRVPYLHALESGDLSGMPSPVQARGFLRNYAEYLGLNIDQLLDELRSEQKTGDQIIGPADLPPLVATQAPELFAAQEAALHPAPEVAPAAQADPQPDPAPSKPKRRGRKKVEPELEPIVDASPEAIDEPVVQIQPGPMVEIPVDTQREESPSPNVSENIWQSWLNRISSAISTRTRPAKPVSNNEPTEAQASNIQAEEQAVTEALVASTENLESIQIFKEIGADLRRRRELLSLHVDEVERSTHVRAHYLEALENGTMDALPSTVQTRGMLSNYATFLDLDVDTLLLRYADALQARHREKNPQRPARDPGQPIVANIPPMRGFIAGDMIFGVGIAVLLIGFSIWGVNRVMLLQSMQEIQPTAPSISDVLLASPDPSLFTPTATLLPADSFAEATVTIVIPTQNLNVSVQVNLVAVERTYMRVIVDGTEVFNGRVVPGTAYPFEAEDQIEVIVGSGAAIRIVYNGRDLGLLGGLGQVVNNIYRADEIITPTAQPTATPTSTSPTTSTVAPTLTPFPTNTPPTASTP
jgi:cytoskeleton protein RodZ